MVLHVSEAFQGIKLINKETISWFSLQLESEFGQHPLKDTLEHPKSVRQVTLSFVGDGFIRKLSSRVRSHIKYSEYLFLLWERRARENRSTEHGNKADWRGTGGRRGKSGSKKL